eukprot:CCRYP_009429-RA/>CCRYP_009429-RA protein AED:0.38 eAED:0.53 QI:0/-1/0/1/-1/0/1/0/102
MSYKYCSTAIHHRIQHKPETLSIRLLPTVMHAMLPLIACTLGSMPGALVYSHNMFLNVPLIADWQALAQHCKQYVNDNLAVPKHTNFNMTMLRVRKPSEENA